MGGSHSSADTERSWDREVVAVLEAVIIADCKKYLIVKSQFMETDSESYQGPYPRVETVDVVVCTWNRAPQLADTLQSLTKLIVPYDRQLRIIVVDNNSTDETAKVIVEFAAHKFFNRHTLLPLFESQQGHTHSRNAAIAHLDSDLVMWTDDDVAVDPFWLQKMVEFADLHPSAAFFGGPIVAKLLPRCPDWIEQNWEILKGCFADRQIGDQPLELTHDRLPYGANFAVRGSVQKAFPFDTELGRRAEDVLGEDELDVMRRMLEAQLSGYWNPEARVTHVIPSERVNEEYVRQYFVGQGRALICKGEAWDYSPRKLWWASLGNYLMFRFKRKFADSPEWLAHLIRSGLAEGQYVQRVD